MHHKTSLVFTSLLAVKLDARPSRIALVGVAPPDYIEQWHNASTTTAYSNDDHVVSVAVIVLCYSAHPDPTRAQLSSQQCNSYGTLWSGVGMVGGGWQLLPLKGSVGGLTLKQLS